MKANFKGFYFNTNIILIDDNDSFLNTLDYRLSEKFAITTYNEPQVALDYLLSESNTNSMFNTMDFVVESHNEEDDSTSFAINFAKFIDFNNIINKKNLTSVLIIDYSMPKMNGVDFCEKINHLPIMKIMLTGHADFKIAVDAFNRGVIDKFLVKDTPDMLDEIVASIEEMQEQYFIKHSSILRSFLPHSCLEILRSAEYEYHLEKLIEEYSIVEYYLLDNEGTYALTSCDGTKYYFKAIPDLKINELLELAIDLGAYSHIINKLKHKTHFPVFLSESDYKLPVNDWEQIMRKTQKKDGYYYIFEKS
ncbi:MAG: response regulator [Tatlockia sp.]|jgi:CheY-like chemotaxis protein